MTILWGQLDNHEYAGEATMNGQATVLVTGGSGFIGSWCAIRLLQQGYAVRTTVRSLARESAVRAAIGKQVDAQERLSFHAAELTSDAGWSAAAAGCDYMLHVASPVVIAEPKNPDDVVIPARDGTRRAVRAALEAGVKRVVLTSSVAAATPRGGGRASLTDETVWTDLDDPEVSAYSRSKTVAERAAWDLVRSSDGATTLATVNPSVVLGPVLSPDYSPSVELIERLLSGKVPGLPRLGFCLVDVRDVADLHIAAMIAPQAAGERFIAAGDFAWMVDVAALLRARLGAAAGKVPTRKVPDFVLRFAALFDRSLASVAPRLGRQRVFSSAKAQKLLGWRPRSTEETVIDCARSLISTG
jgi:dihydroflavonol-4-reductase